MPVGYVVSLLDDVGERNGGTLLIPGSHRLIAEAYARGEPIGVLSYTVPIE